MVSESEKKALGFMGAAAAASVLLAAIGRAQARPGVPPGPPPEGPPGKVQLTIEAMEGGTTSPSPGAYLYDRGAVVDVDSVPFPGWVSWYWHLDGRYAGSAKRITVTMDANHVSTAYFARPVGVTIVNERAIASIVGVFKAGTYYEWTIPAGQTETRNVYVDSTLMPYGAMFLEAPVTPPTVSTWIVTGPVTLHVV